MKIKIACEGAARIELDQLHEFQGDLKSLSKDGFSRLRKEILESGFAFPIQVWKDADGQNHIIGGHQRVRVLKELRAEGYEVASLPVNFIEADGYIQAKRRVLQDVGQYGEIDRQGLYEFLLDAELGPGELASSFQLPDLDIPSFNSEFFLDDVTGSDMGSTKMGAKEISADDFNKFSHKCPRCSFEFD